MKQLLVILSLLTYQLPATAVSSAAHLFAAARSGDLATLQKAQNLKVLNEDQESLLMVAAAEGHLPVVKWLTEKSVDLNVKDSSGETALFKAIGSGEERVAAHLIERDARLDILYGPRNEPITFECARMGLAEVLAKILQKNPDLLNSQNINGNSALHEAVLASQSKTAEVLLKANINRKLKNKAGQVAESIVSTADKALKKLFKH